MTPDQRTDPIYPESTNHAIPHWYGLQRSRDARGAKPCGTGQSYADISEGQAGDSDDESMILERKKGYIYIYIYINSDNLVCVRFPVIRVTTEQMMEPDPHAKQCHQGKFLIEFNLSPKARSCQQHNIMMISTVERAVNRSVRMI